MKNIDPLLVAKMLGLRMHGGNIYNVFGEDRGTSLRSALIYELLTQYEVLVSIVHHIAYNIDPLDVADTASDLAQKTLFLLDQSRPSQTVDEVVKKIEESVL